MPERAPFDHAKLRRLRDAADPRITQRALSEKAGVSLAFIKLLESEGCTVQPSPPFVAALAGALGVAPSDLHKPQDAAA